MDKELFNPITVEKFCSKVKLTSKQKTAAKSWLYLLEQGKLKKEKLNYFKFVGYILNDLLGYDFKKDMDHEAGNIEFSFKNKEGKTVLGIEAKGTKTKDLSAEQKGYKKGQETPIIQLWTYMGNLNLDYGIATNYKEFILIDRSKGMSTYHFFDFEEVKNNEQKLKEFVAIFSKEQIIDNKFIEKLKEESVIEERKFTKEFYKLFHETRLMIIKEIQESGISKIPSIHFAQLFLNRLMFVFFAEDTGKLEKRIIESRIYDALGNESSFSSNSTNISNVIRNLFEDLNKGSSFPKKIFGFNGGLFKDPIPDKIHFNDLRDKKFFKEVYQHYHLKKHPKLNENEQKLFNKYENRLSPIIKNILLMATFDFNSEVNVNILGHIFEQSLSDIEKIKEGKVSKRKKEGIYYTPEYITDYICKNTIIPYLSNKNLVTPRELVLEYQNNIKELEKKFSEIKILDPACGSGAFLIKAIDILLEIHKEIQLFKQNKGEYTAIKKGRKKKKDEGQLMLVKWNEEDEAREIIENNIFGVDINEESVEITKLSLFLKIVKKNRKLIDLSKNIKCGNSLIDDKKVDIRAFNWEKEFSFKFDVVIGNPPYVKVQNLKHNEIDWYKSNKKTAFKRVDISILFIELAKKLLKENGFVAYITSNQFLITEYGRKVRQFILDNYKIREMVDFGDLSIFEKASTYVSIFIFENNKKSNFKYIKIKNLKKAQDFNIKNGIEIDIKKLNDDSWILTIQEELVLIDKLNSLNKLGEIGNAWAGIITGLDKVLMFDKKEIKEKDFESDLILPIIRGSDPKRYSYAQPSKFILYPYKIKGGKTVVLTEPELKNFPKVYNYLLKNKLKLSKRKDSRKTFESKKDWFALIRFGHKEIFDKIKIVTPGEVKEHKFSLDASKSGFSCARVFAITIKNKLYNIKYILSILNSNLIKFYLRNIAPLKQGGFYTYSSTILNQIPIEEISPKKQKPFIEKVDLMLKLNKEFYEKKTKFLNRIKQNLNINKITKKLEKLYEFNFEEFCKELQKQRTKLSIKQQDEWEDYFEDYKKEMINLKDKIDEIDKEINQEVYNLYNLTKKEMNIIEDSFNKNGV